MSPDMKRLCEAADKAFARSWAFWDGGEHPAIAEAIVRAVLIELREVSPKVAETCGGVEGNDATWDYSGRPLGPDIARNVIHEMVDAILDDPASA